METQGSFSESQLTKDQIVSAFDRRHPNKATLDYLLAKEVDIPANYEQTRISMEAFFEAGHVRPGEDESY